jgi:16S rRNA (cytidine1402-2'-O)-methyltransferase
MLAPWVVGCMKIRRRATGPYIARMTTPDGAVGRLVVCPTPIGNLGDVTLRVLDALREADAIACEDTRRTRVLLDRYEIVATLLSYHEHNERERAGELVGRIAGGWVVALVSDAGMPLVSDPGYKLVRACIEAGLPVEVLPGASSVVTAVVAAGLPAERWRFVGFLPRKRAELERVLSDTPETLVAFESPQRLAATLGVLAERDPERPAVVCRELTKLHEEVRRGSAAELAAHYAEHASRGEIVLVVGVGAPGGADRVQALAALRALVDAGARARPAAGVVAKLTGVGANELYRELTDI